MMKLTRRFHLLLMPCLMAGVLILSVLFPASVLADDDPPTPQPTPDISSTPDADSVATNDVTAPTLEIEPTLTNEPVLVTPVDSPITSPETSLQNNGTEVSVSADDSTSNVLNGKLPIWCPAGVDPIPGEGGCTAEFGTMSLLMDYLNQNGLANDGKIWISQLGTPNPSNDIVSSDQTQTDQTQNSDHDGNQAQSGVNIVILDGSGNSLPLSDQDATDAILNGQPVWCPDGITPDTGNDSCTSSVESLGLLVSMMENGSLDNGTIYVQTSSASPQPVSDHANVADPSNVDANDFSIAAGEANNQSGSVIDNSTEQTLPSLENTSVPESTPVANDISIQDPIWCPDTIAPIASSGGCTASFLDLDTLVTFLQANQPTLNGTIWMENVTFSSTTPIVIDGSVSTTWATNSLTFQGGWTGGGTTSSISGNTTLAQSISVVNWLNNISMNNLVVQAGVNSNGLTVQTSGNVSMDNVTSNNNTGASPNGYGINITADGSVSIKNTTADGNRVGIRVNANGTGQPVNLDNITANGNSGTSIAIFSLGDISAQNISASNNGGSGLRLANSGGTGSISIFGSNSFGNNGNAGVFADSTGNINIQNVTVSSSPSSNDMSVTTSSSSGIIIACSAFNSSITHFGFDASNYSTLQINGVTFSGTGGTYTTTGSGTVTTNSSCTPSGGGGTGGGGGGNGNGQTFIGTITSSQASALNIVNVGDNDSNALQLDCINFSGTQLTLPNGDRVAYLCPTTGDANLSRVEKETLPGVLPTNFDLISGMSTTLKVNSADQGATPGQLDISFVIPVDMVGFDFTILYWDSTAWQDLSTATFSDGKKVFNPGTKTQDGRFEAVTNFTGTFVLVRK